MRYVRYRINPVLAGILGDLAESPLGPALSDRLEQLATIAGPTPSRDQLTADLAPHLWLLERAANGGIPLTSAGINTQPVLYFRDHVRRVGLVRTTNSTLVATAAGRRASTDPEALWRHLADRIIPHRRGFDWVATTLILLHAGTSDGDDLNRNVIAQTLGALGWRHTGGHPVLARDVQWVWNDVWAALGNVGPRPDTSGKWHDRTLSPTAVALVRDTLLDQTTP